MSKSQEYDSRGASHKDGKDYKCRPPAPEEAWHLNVKQRSEPGEETLPEVFTLLELWLRE